MVEPQEFDKAPRRPWLTLLLVFLLAIALVIGLANRLRGDAVASPSAISSTTLPGECPHLIPYEGGSGVGNDRILMVIWLGNIYSLGNSTVAQPGEQIFKVTCGSQDLEESATHYRSEPWPDGSSNALARGTRVHAVPGQPIDCALTAKISGQWRVFTRGPC